MVGIRRRIASPLEEWQQWQLNDQKEILFGMMQNYE